MKKRYLGLLIPSIILLVSGLVGVGFGAYFIGVTQNPQEVTSLGEALGMAFGLVIILAIGVSVLIVGLALIVIGIPLFIGGLSLHNKDKKVYLESNNGKE